jgi:hypothetical protein
MSAPVAPGETQGQAQNPDSPGPVVKPHPERIARKLSLQKMCHGSLIYGVAYSKTILPIHE